MELALPLYSACLGSFRGNSLPVLGMVMCIQAHFTSSLGGVPSLVCSMGTAVWFDWILLVLLLLLFNWDLDSNFCIRGKRYSVVSGILPNSRGESVTGVIYCVLFLI